MTAAQLCVSLASRRQQDFRLRNQSVCRIVELRDRIINTMAAEELGEYLHSSSDSLSCAPELRSVGLPEERKNATVWTYPGHWGTLYTPRIGEV